MLSLTTKFVKPVSDYFTKKSFTAELAGNQYEFLNDHAIVVRALDTVPMTDYSNTQNIMNGSRFGDVGDLQIHEYQYNTNRARAATFVIDQFDEVNDDCIRNVQKALKAQLDEKAMPEFDKYNIGRWSDAAGTRENYDSTSGQTVWESLVKLGCDMDDALVPRADRVLIVGTEMYQKIITAPNFMYANDIAKKHYVGEIGTIDDLRVIRVPQFYLPSGIKGMITTKAALLCPQKLKYFKIHESVPGLMGSLVEICLVYDAFVIDTKREGVGTLMASASDWMEQTNAVLSLSDTNISNAFSFDTSLGTATSGMQVYYTLDGSDPFNSENAFDASIDSIETAINTVGALGTGDWVKLRTVVVGDKYCSEVVNYKAIKKNDATAPNKFVRMGRHERV